MRLHAPSLALALALSSSALHAQDVTARRRAMIDQAASLSRAGDHRQAIELLTRAGSLRMTPGLRMVLAQEQRLADRTADAFDTATRCLVELGTSNEDGRAQIEAECRAIVDALRARVGRLRVVAPSPAPAGFRVEVGGVATDLARLAEPITVAPGEVTVIASASDGTRFTSTVTVTAGGERTVTVALTSSTATAPTAPAAVVTASASSGEVGGVAVGEAGLCARLVGGRVMCWGYLGGALGMSAIEGVSGASALSVGSDHGCAVVAGGRLRCWGSNMYVRFAEPSVSQSAEAVEVTGVSGAVGVASGGRHACVALGDGRVQCFGDNGGGQLGDGTTMNRAAPVAVMGVTDASAVGGGLTHTCFVRRAGGLRCVGQNMRGQLGDRTTMNRTTPVDVMGITDAARVTGGSDFTCVTRAMGGVTCFGGNANGQLGRGSMSASIPEPGAPTGL